MELPKDFIQLIREQYGNDIAETLFKALTETEPEVSIRLNRRKLCTLSSQISTLRLSPVPWCPDAFYIKGERPAFTFDPLLHAGAYYVQEASSMYIAQYIEQFKVQRAQRASSPNGSSGSTSQEGTPVVLDLCAAPGGKSTLLASLLPEGSLLISNEPIPKRAQILCENMQKWTRMPIGEEYPVASIVTNSYPADFRAMTDTVDLLLCDVPCSGEGMFRKDDEAVRQWSLDKVQQCQSLQREILSDILHVLRPGGMLIYSTCTFNHMEDEDNVQWLQDKFGLQLLEQRHFLPGRDRGEGFFCAALTAPQPLKAYSNHPEGKASYIPTEDVIRKVQKTLRVMSPAFELEDDAPQVELSYDEALAYLRHEAIRVPAERGQVILTYRGLPLGPGKCVGNRINNLYPQEWRIRTTYNKKFSIL